MRFLSNVYPLPILIYRAIDINSLVGNIGGYVGLLLGVSILQVLNTMVRLYGNIMKSYMNKARPSATTTFNNAAAENGETHFKSKLSLRSCEDTWEIVQQKNSCKT